MRRSARSSGPSGSARALAAASALAAAAFAGEAGPSLVVVREGSERALPVETARGYPAVALGDLATALGYAWSAEAVDLEEGRVEFVLGSPFFRFGGRVHQLAFPPYRAAEAVMLPAQWATEWLPSVAPRRWRYADGRLTAWAEPKPAATPRPRRPDRWVVVIDPGHGGVDPGSIGPRGTREKDVALAVALELARALEQNPRIQVILTRTADTLIALADRPRIANEAGGDFFLSVHANALSRRSEISGFETYFLAVAKTEDAARVAQMENAAARFELGSGAGELDPITFMLRDLIQNAYLIESLRLAEHGQGALDATLDTPNRGVKQAGFYVLVGATMPAVLVEVGYITHPREEMLLRSPTNLRRIAGALARATESYLQSYGRRFWTGEGAGGS